MVTGNFASKIKPFIMLEMAGILRVAESDYPCPKKMDLKPGIRSSCIKELAELILISRLVDLKGDWLSMIEMQYTLDLFHVHCKSYERFNKLGFENGKGGGLLNEVREYMSVQNDMKVHHGRAS